VHRLDSCTSGVLIAAKNREYAGFFGTLFQERNDLQKLYIAVAQGRIDGGSAWQGKIDLPL
jgi:23S rRNA-/tRNA-specific pseudouridylate synthase